MVNYCANNGASALINSLMKSNYESSLINFEEF